MPEVVISPAEIEAIFQRPGFLRQPSRETPVPSVHPEVAALREVIDAAAAKSFDDGVDLPLERIRRRCRLTPLEYQVLVVSLVCASDSVYQRLLGYIQNDVTKKSASIYSLIHLLSPSLTLSRASLEPFLPSGRLRRFGLVDVLSSDLPGPLSVGSLQVDEELLGCCLGIDSSEHSCRGALSRNPMAWERVSINSDLRELLRNFESRIRQIKDPSGWVLALAGEAGVGRTTIACALATSLGKRLLTLDVPELLRTEDHLDDLVRSAVRDALFCDGILCLTGIGMGTCSVEGGRDSVFKQRRLLHRLAALGESFIVTGSNIHSVLPPMPQNILSLRVDRPTGDQQLRIWTHELTQVGQTLGADRLENLVRRFDLTGGQIHEAVRLANRTASDSESISEDACLQAARSVSLVKLDRFARRLDPKFTRSQLVLPWDKLGQLDEMVEQVLRQCVVMEDWDFRSRFSPGCGFSALFCGPSGTGKTMAAEVFAGELRLSLYKINLSAVVSKYIGETEKNLEQVFNQAEHSNAVLFFDEADALLGKRSEVRDAHDRYANLEVAYLLQKMEEFEGITILATNFRQNIDEAFTRRLRFVVDFPMPTPEYRLSIWEKIWPDPERLDRSVDLEFMARQFEFSGGNIRNVALGAAFLASGDGGRVTMAILLRAARREFEKMGRIYSASDFGRFASLIEEQSTNRDDTPREIRPAALM